MKHILAFLLLSLLLNVNGQKITNSNISCIGANLESNNNGMDLNVGELIVTPLKSDSISISGGIIEGVLSTTSISETPEYNIGLKIYPNPASNKVIIEFPDEIKNISVLIYNNNGRLIMSEKEYSHGNIINLCLLPKGMYIISIKHNNLLISSKKIIKE